ncbi:hypothetical protein M422DRAFT_195601, partial [Sphaerobolus stellatus SS14]
PEAKWVMSVCAGSAILALAGILHGKRATPNNFLYKTITNVYGRDGMITWLPKARWVADGNVWASSGITACMEVNILNIKSHTDSFKAQVPTWLWDFFGGTRWSQSYSNYLCHVGDRIV